MSDWTEPAIRVADPTLGQSLVAERVGGCWLSEVRYPAAAHYRLHAHEHSYVCLVTAGAFEERIGSRRFHAATGAVVMMPLGWEHDDRISRDGARSFVVSLPPSSELARIRTGRVVIGGSPVRAMIALWRAMRRGRLSDDTLADQLALIDADDELAGSRRGREVAHRARLSMEERCREHGDTSVGGIASSLGVHRSYLARVFHGTFGCTMAAYRQQLRVHLALAALSRGVPPAEAAVQAGFTDQSHLTRSMRRHLDIAPGEYRRLSACRSA